MTTNQQRAAEVLLEKDSEESFAVATNHDAFLLASEQRRADAQALADAGLLMPDLPAPHTVDRYPGSVCWEVCTDPSVAARRHVGVRVDHMRSIKTNITGEVTPDEAREAAYSLIAAANHAEQEQDHG